jgi:hypothetical protein
MARVLDLTLIDQAADGAAPRCINVYFQLEARDMGLGKRLKIATDPDLRVLIEKPAPIGVASAFGHGLKLGSPAQSAKRAVLSFGGRLTTPPGQDARPGKAKAEKPEEPKEAPRKKAHRWI